MPGTSTTFTQPRTIYQASEVPKTTVNPSPGAEVFDSSQPPAITSNNCRPRAYATPWISSSTAYCELGMVGGQYGMQSTLEESGSESMPYPPPYTTAVAVPEPTHCSSAAFDSGFGLPDSSSSLDTEMPNDICHNYHDYGTSASAFPVQPDIRTYMYTNGMDPALEFPYFMRKMYPASTMGHAVADYPPIQISMENLALREPYPHSTTRYVGNSQYPGVHQAADTFRDNTGGRADVLKGDVLPSKANHHQQSTKYERRPNQAMEAADRRHNSFAELETVTSSDFKLAAAAGFYYTGDEKVRCFSCDNTLNLALLKKDFWETHLVYFPNCPFLRQEKGDDYVRPSLEREDRVKEFIRLSECLREELQQTACTVDELLNREAVLFTNEQDFFKNDLAWSGRDRGLFDEMRSERLNRHVKEVYYLVRLSSKTRNEIERSTNVLQHAPDVTLRFVSLHCCEEQFCNKFLAFQKEEYLQVPLKEERWCRLLTLAQKLIQINQAKYQHSLTHYGNSSNSTESSETDALCQIEQHLLVTLGFSEPERALKDQLIDHVYRRLQPEVVALVQHSAQLRERLDSDETMDEKLSDTLTTLTQKEQMILQAGILRCCESGKLAELRHQLLLERHERQRIISLLGLRSFKHNADSTCNLCETFFMTDYCVQVDIEAEPDNREIIEQSRALVQHICNHLGKVRNKKNKEFGSVFSTCSVELRGSCTNGLKTGRVDELDFLVNLNDLKARGDNGWELIGDSHQLAVFTGNKRSKAVHLESCWQIQRPQRDVTSKKTKKIHRFAVDCPHTSKRFISARELKVDFDDAIEKVLSNMDQTHECQQNSAGSLRFFYSNNILFYLPPHKSYYVKVDITPCLTYVPQQTPKYPIVLVPSSGFDNWKRVNVDPSEMSAETVPQAIRILKTLRDIAETDQEKHYCDQMYLILDHGPKFYSSLEDASREVSQYFAQMQTRPVCSRVSSFAVVGTVVQQFRENGDQPLCTLVINSLLNIKHVSPDGAPICRRDYGDENALDTLRLSSANLIRRLQSACSEDDTEGAIRRVLPPFYNSGAHSSCNLEGLVNLTPVEPCQLPIETSRDCTTQESASSAMSAPIKHALDVKVHRVRKEEFISLFQRIATSEQKEHTARRTLERLQRNLASELYVVVIESPGQLLCATYDSFTQICATAPTIQALLGKSQLPKSALIDIQEAAV